MSLWTQLNKTKSLLLRINWMEFNPTWIYRSAFSYICVYIYALIYMIIQVIINWSFSPIPIFSIVVWELPKKQFYFRVRVSLRLTDRQSVCLPTRGWVCPLSVIFHSLGQYVDELFKVFMFNMYDIYNIYTSPCQSMLGTADYALQVVAKPTTALLDTWTVVHVTAAKFKPFIHSMSGFALLRTLSLSWFWIIFACCLHNFVMKS
jgi:hypothetical protein